MKKEQKQKPEAHIVGAALKVNGEVIAIERDGKVTTPDGVVLGETLFQVGKDLGYWVVTVIGNGKEKPPQPVKAAKPVKKADPIASRRRALAAFATEAGGHAQTRNGFMILTLADSKGKEGQIRVQLDTGVVAPFYPKEAGISQRSRSDYLARHYQDRIKAVLA